MDNQYSRPQTTGSKLLLSLGILLRFIGFIIVGAITATALFSLLTGVPVEDIPLMADQANENTKMLLWMLQGINQLFMFIVLPLLYVYFLNKHLYPQFLLQKKNLGLYSLIAILVIFASIPIINWMAEWNKSIELPDFMADVESWMQSKEYAAKKMTEAIAYYNGPFEFMIALLVMAILPGLGEELMFRGILQNEFSAVLKNPHAGIWIAGFIFSFFHFQFYGFFPRLFLGVTFGYLYYWSGNLFIPILIHFMNNALTLIAMNLYKQKVINIDPESAESIPLISVVISIAVFSFLLLTFNRLNKTPGTNH